jgi:hypothetical protein
VHENSKDWRRAIRRMYDWDAGAGDPPRTPLGHAVVSRHAALNERIEEDLRVYGRAAHSPSSAYRLQALYLDFGRVGLAEHLAQSVLRALDVARDEAGIGAREPLLLEAERQFFGDLEDEDSIRVDERVARLSRRALMTALVFNAHFWNVRLALEVVGGNQGLERAAVGMCAFVAEARIGRGLGGDLRYFAPLRQRQEAFCVNHCLPVIGSRPSDDRPCVPPRMPFNCGMLKILEEFRFFASFPDE